MWTPDDQRSMAETANFAAIASLIVGLGAIVLAWLAWTRPFPDDPTQIPSWGSPGSQREIANPAEAQVFFDWLEENTGRKVRIFIDLDADYFAAREADPNNPNHDYDLGYSGPSEGGFDIQSSTCPDSPYIDTELARYTGYPCRTNRLIVDTSDGRRGLSTLDRRGVWNLQGYFANTGFTGTASGGYDMYEITPLTVIEAVG